MLPDLAQVIVLTRHKVTYLITNLLQDNHRLEIEQI